MTQRNGAVIPLTSKRTDIFTPASLKPQDDGNGATTGGEREISFELRIPTPSERDTIGTRLFELGLTSVSQETIRATLIDELYRIDWTGSRQFVEGGMGIVATQGMIDAGAAAVKAAKKGAEPAEVATSVFSAMIAVDATEKADNEAIADEHAEFLDGYWTRQQVDERLIAEWQEREGERIRDQKEGAPVIEPEPMPRGSIRPREHSKAKLLVDEVMERSTRLRQLAARQLDYGRQNQQMMARIHIISLGAVGEAAAELVKSGLELQRDHTGLLTVETVDAIREFIGPLAWAELIQRIEAHYELGGIERKNSDSPQGKPSDQTGSPEQSGASGNSGGSSTGSSTEPAPAAA